MSNYEDVIFDLNILFEYPVNLPYKRTNLKYKNKYIIYKYDNKKFVKVYDGDNQCHMIYVGDFWKGSAIGKYLNKDKDMGKWWSPQYE